MHDSTSVPLESESSAGLSRGPVRWLLLFAIWTVPAVLTASLIHTRMVQIGQPSHLGVWLLGKCLGWWMWALLTPLVVRLGRRFRLERPLSTNTLVHIFAGAVIGSFQSAYAVYVSMLSHGELLTPATYLKELVPFLMYNAPSGFLIYWGVLGISYAFEYRSRLRERELAASRLEAQVTRARLDALQQQLQPHFLFNTLNSIAVLIQKGDAKPADRMLRGLSELLRIVLARSERKEVTLADELEFVRRYVEIEIIRYGDRLHVDFAVPEAARTALVPTFILQTLVENAVRHGIAPRPEAGRVIITAATQKGRLKVAVCDDGVGLTEGSDPLEGLGLSNARRRLAHLYGNDFSFELRNGADSGVIASLDIPLRAAAAATGKPA